MDEKLKKYFSSGINPFADESIDFDEALRRKLVMEGVEEPAANDETYLETQEMADERVKKGLEQSTVEPVAEEMTMGQEAIENKAQAKYPTEEAIQARLDEVNPQPVEMPEEAIPAENDLAAEQAQVARDNLDKSVDPSQTNMLNTTLTAQDGGLKQEELRKNDPVAYVREKYGIAPGAQREEMMKDTDYESLKSMQKRTGILGALSEVDTAVGGMGDWKLLEAKKGGYGGNYKGGALGRMAAGERANFEERSKFRDADLDRQTKGLTQEKSGQELKEKMRAFDMMIENEKEQSKLEGPIYDLTKQFYESTLGKPLPPGVSPKKLFNVFPQFKDLLKEKMSNEFTAEQSRLNRENQLKLKEMENQAKLAEKGPKRTDEQKALGKKTAEALAGTKGFNETVQLLDSLSDSKLILGKLDPATGKKSPKASDMVSGGIIGVLPGFARRLISTPSSQVESDIAGVLALPNLKSIFGGNPTEGERKTLLETLFDDVQDESEILRRVEALERRMLASAKENDRKKEWIAEYGNLDNYKPGIPEGLSSVTKELATEFGIKQKPQAGQVVVVQGKRYRVGEDGDSLEEIK